MSWRNNINHLDLRDAQDLARLDCRRSLFLAAGVPDPGSPYIAKPREIMAAVVALVSLCFHHRLRLVFGAHPAISPMVLFAAREAQAPQDSVLVFQSLHFEKSLPKSTLELARWDAGLMLLTPNVSNDRDASLTLMRTLMLQVPGLCGAVFLGGMRGLEEEHNLFAQYNPGMPRFAVASTGGCAAQLLDDHGSVVRGSANNLLAEDILRDEDAYSYVMHEIVARL